MWIMAADGLGPVKRFSVSAIGDLMSATESASYDSRSAGTAAKGSKEAFFANLHRKVVVFFFIPEVARNATASRVKLLDGHSRDPIEKAFHSGGAKEGFLVAVAMD